MPRKVSFVVLLVILSAIAVLFFQVMANFMLPIFLALLLAMMFGPLHRWLVARCQGRDRIAAFLTTIAILLICLVPFLLVLLQAASEGVAYYERAATQAVHRDSQEQARAASEGAPRADRPDVGLGDEQIESAVNALNENFHLKVSADQVRTAIQTKVQEWLGPLVLGMTQYAGGTLLGLIIMVVSLYYFLADGPGMIQTVMRISPLDERYEEQLVSEFENIVRAVVTATLLTAVAQSLLAGIGFYLVGIKSVFLLMTLTMFLAMVPFFGAASVWIPVCLWLFFHEGRTLAAVLMGLYGAGVVSVVDNIIKPWVLHGRSNLHPLLALLSIIGGVQALGPIGIFVGPMVVVFLNTLLRMVQTEIISIDRESKAASAAATNPVKHATARG